MALENLTQELIYTFKEGVAKLILNRPESRNAITMTMFAGIREVAEEVGRNDDVKVLIITGAGRGFCPGADMSLLRDAVGGETLGKAHNNLVEPFGYLSVIVRNLAKPIIGAINGAAVGAGLSIALLSDIRIASDQAKFGAFWVRMGLVPDYGGSYLLPWAVGLSKALELTLTGDLIDAYEAEKIGLISRVVPHEDLMKVTEELALKIAKGPSVAIELTKRGMCRALNNDLETQLEFEGYGQNVCFKTEDFKEATSAFLEKREPHFRGL